MLTRADGSSEASSSPSIFSLGVMQARAANASTLAQAALRGLQAAPCAIPDASSLLFRVFRHRWYDLDLPRHLFHFTPASIRMLLEHTGWRVDVIKPQATSNCLFGSLGYALRERRGFVGRLGAALLAFPDSRSPLKPLAAPLSWALTGAFQTGRIVVWAQAE